MSTIVLRATKGSPLTNTEVDTNFSNLNTDKLEATYAGAMNSLTGGTSIVTLGTVTAGTWSATTIGTTKGGTGLTSYATGDTLFASASNTLSKLSSPAATTALTTVIITGTGGTFTCASTTLYVNQTITITGTLGGTGTISGYSNPTTYFIITTNGTTSFTLSATLGGSAITTTAGTPTGLTYTLNGSTSILQMTTSGVPSWVPLSSTQITSLGTITSGVWNGSVIGAAYGGTGIANNAANTIAFTGNYSLGLTLSANTSLTLPTTGTLATVAGSEALTNKSINGLTVTSSTGTLTITNAKVLSVSNTLTFTGSDASSVAFGAGGTVAYTNVGTLSSLVSIGTITTGVWQGTAIGAVYGGTGQTSYATGDIVYASATNTLSKLTAGTDGQVLTLASGVPSWTNQTGASTGKAIAMALVFGG